MKEINKKVLALVHKSKDILAELEKDQPSIEILQKLLDKRQVSVNELDLLTKKFHSGQLSNEETDSLKNLVEQFNELNQAIQQKLNDKLNEHRQHLTAATNHRKAEDGYRLLREPDISYF